MKKVLSLLLMLVMLLSLCACGEDEPQTTDPIIYDPATAVGTWFLEGVNNTSTEYETMYLTLGEETASINIAYYGKLEYSSQEMLDSILENGYYASEDGGYSYYYDIQKYNGVYYHSAMYGYYAEGTYTVSDNTITVTLTSYYGITGDLVLTITSEETLSYVSVGEELMDETIREVLNNGKVFAKTEPPQDEG